jgi:hypothetical protein
MKTLRFFAWALASLAIAVIPAAAQSQRAKSSATELFPAGLFAAPQGTVGFGDAYSFVAHESDPSACFKGEVEFNLSSSTPKYCSASNTWTSFASSSSASGTVNSGTQYAFGEYAASGTSISSGPTPPSSDGQYYCGYAVTASAAVAPSCWLNALTPRAVTGSTSTDTILYSDSIVEYQGSVAVATSLPAPATLGNSGFYVRLLNTTSGSATAVTVTAGGSFTFSSTGTATLAIAQGQSCSLLVDPAGGVWDDTYGDLPLTAGTNVTITRGRYGPTISASGGTAGVTSFSGDGTFATNSASTGAVTLTLGAAGAHQWWGNNAGSTAAPGYESLTSADIPNNAANTTGNAATATALGATPTQCSGSNFATGIAASGNANCAEPANSSGNAATATALAATPTQCSGSNFAQGIAASGNANCAEPVNSTGNAATATALASTPAQCTGSNFATGISASGNANCSTPSGGTFIPATATLFDDFMSANALSSLGWAANGGGGSVSMQPTAAGEQFANHPGIAALNSGGTGGGTDWEFYILGNQNNPEINPTANSFTIYADFVNGGGTSSAVTGTVRFGLFDSTSMNEEAPHSGVYFEAVGSGGSAPTWNCVVNTAGTPTSASSGVTAPVGTSTFHILELVFTASTSVTFMIDGSTVCSSLSATLPSALMNSAFEATDNSSGPATLLIDYFRINWNLTR